MAKMELAVLIQKYVLIRDAKDAAKKLFDGETKRITDALKKLDGMILEALGDAESVKTEFGTAYTKSRSSCSVKDRGEFYNWAVNSGNLEAIDMKANAKIVRELLDEGVEVPGVKYSAIIQVGIRRA